MSFYVNDVALNSITFNNQDVNAVYYNGTHIWGQMIWDGLDKSSWSDLQALCKAKQSGAITTWPSDIVLGATKTVNLSSELYGITSFEAKIIGIDTDFDGSITFMAATGTPSKITFSSSTTTQANRYFWSYSKLRTACNELYEASDVYGSVYRKSVKTYTASSTLGTTNSYFWALSSREVGLTNSYWDKESDTTITGESSSGLPYPYFTSDSTRVLKKPDGSSCTWWLRSVNNGNYSSERVANVNTSGIGGSGTASSNTYSIVPAFTIG